jgi:transposase-like protein
MIGDYYCLAAQLAKKFIQQETWLYFRFTLSFRDLEDLLTERGIPRWEKAVRDLHRSGWRK